MSNIELLPTAAAANGGYEVKKDGNSYYVDKEVFNLIQDLSTQLTEQQELIKAVAHVGLDWGYGKFELTPEHIAKARSLYEGQLNTHKEQQPDE